MSDITRSKKIAKRIKSLKGKIPSGGDLRDFARLVSKVTKKTSRPGKLFANCCECGRIVDTREHYEGGDDHGCELDNGKWVCSFDCWDIAVERDLPDEMRLKLERERKIDEVARLLEGEDMSFIQEVFDKLSLVDSKGNECKYFTSPVPHDEVFADDDDVYEFEIEINNETFPGLADVDVPDIVVTVQCAIRGEGEKASWIAVSQIALIAEDDEEDSSEAMQAGDHCDSPAAEISDTSEPSHSIPISAEKWSVYWPNDCGRTAVSALRYLAQHERPTGGESLYNAAHLEMIAFEVEAVQKCLETLKTADTWQVATFSQVTQALRQLSQDDHLFTPDYLINLADQLERLGATCISLESPAPKIEVSQKKGPDAWMILPDDCWTHLGDFSNACEIALKKAEDELDEADTSYWRHQLQTIENIRAYVDGDVGNRKLLPTRERVAMVPEEFNGLYAPAGGWTMEEMREHLHGSSLHKKGDARLVWINEGDLHIFEALGLLQKAETP